MSWISKILPSGVRSGDGEKRASVACFAEEAVHGVAVRRDTGVQDRAVFVGVFTGGGGVR